MKLNKLSVLIPLIVSVVGIIVITLVFASQSSITSTYQNNLPLIGLSDNVRYNVTKGHLWFEEFMAGDNSIDPEKDVIRLFKDSRNLLDSTLQDTKGEIDDPELLLSIRKGITDIDELEVVTRQRWESRDKVSDSTHSSSAGNDLDQVFDAKYENIMITMNEVYKIVNTEVDKDIRSAHTLGIVTLFILAAIFGTIAFILYKFQKKNEISIEAQKAKMQEEEIRIQQMTEFANTIGQGNYESQIALNTEDSLSGALVNMRDKLKNMSNEDKKRDWVNSGLAQMGDILRSGYENSDKMYFNIIAFIVRYLDANQGGLFTINEMENTVDLSACVAYDRQKFINKQIGIGEGLVGRSILEKASIYMTEIPADYIEISSGLGHARPSQVFICPMKINDEVYGVIEIASFRPIEKYQQDFIEKISETVASTISNIRTNEKTRTLLEQSQQQTEELRAQEEETRQNMEELSATQEELQRNVQAIETIRRELQQKEDIFNITCVLTETDPFGNILSVNNKFSELSGYTNEELIGQSYQVTRHPDMPDELYEAFSMAIRSGKTFHGISKNKTKRGGHYWLDTTTVSVKDQHGQIVKYISASYPIKNEELAQKLFKEQLTGLSL